MDRDDLERLLDSELKQLPPPRAPRTLLPRVLAAAGVSPLPWYRRPWLTWPAGAQAVSALALALFVTFFWLFVRDVGMPSGMRQALGGASDAAALVNLVSRLLLQPVAIYLTAVALSLSTACAALWYAVNRAALGGASWESH